jgi:hypothetical protein
MHPEQVSDSLGNGQRVGIAITYTKYHTTHTGITYQWRGTRYLYHQAFQVDTRLEPFDPAVVALGGATLVAALPLRRDRQLAMAGFLDSLRKINPQYPYSLKYDPKARIDKTLGKLITSDGKGLSCVTFVLAIFQSFQVRLLNAGTWPVNRPKDLEAQERLLEMLKNNPNATAEHKQAVRAERGCTRIRPEELVGAGCYVAWPVLFSQAEPASLHLLKRLSTILGVPPWMLYPETA